MERLQKILSQAGIASRRASERLMLDGRVTVNGVTVRELGTKADAAHDDIRVDGCRIHLARRRRYLLLNKPRGFVSTRSDPERRPTVLDLLRGVHEYVYPVGRLDFDSEGLLLLTNDGDLAARLMHPRHGVARVYEARVLGIPDAHDLDHLRKGIVVDGEKTAPADVSLRPSGGLRQARARRELRRGSRVYARSRAHSVRQGGVPRASRNDEGGALHATLHITVREGRNRQVRRMCEAIGHPVTHLRRVAIGPIRDPGLKIGQWRELRDDEVEKLRAAVRPAPDAVRAHDKGHTLHRSIASADKPIRR